MIPFRDRLTCSIEDAAEATGIGRTKIYELIDAGQIRTKKLGYNRLVDVQSLLELLDLCPQIDLHAKPEFERTQSDAGGRITKKKLFPRNVLSEKRAI